MNATYCTVGATVAIALLLYLFFALLKPEALQ